MSKILKSDGVLRRPTPDAGQQVGQNKGLQVQDLPASQPGKLSEQLLKERTGLGETGQVASNFATKNDQAGQVAKQQGGVLGLLAGSMEDCEILSRLQADTTLDNPREFFDLPLSAKLDPALREANAAQLDKIDKLLDRALVDQGFDPEEMNQLVDALEALPPDARAAMQDQLVELPTLIFSMENDREAYRDFKQHISDPSQARTGKGVPPSRASSDLAAAHRLEREDKVREEGLENAANQLYRDLGLGTPVFSAKPDWLKRTMREIGDELPQVRKKYEELYGSKLVDDMGKELTISEWEGVNEAAGGALGEHPSSKRAGLLKDLFSRLGIEMGEGWSPSEVIRKIER